jgi:hypothetical protein
MSRNGFGNDSSAPDISVTDAETFSSSEDEDAAVEGDTISRPSQRTSEQVLTSNSCRSISSDTRRVMAVERRMIYLNSHATVLQTELISIRQSTTPESKVRATNNTNYTVNATIILIT